MATREAFRPRFASVLRLDDLRIGRIPEEILEIQRSPSESNTSRSTTESGSQSFRGRRDDESSEDDASLRVPWESQWSPHFATDSQHFAVDFAIFCGGFLNILPRIS